MRQPSSSYPHIVAIAQAVWPLPGPSIWSYGNIEVTDGGEGSAGEDMPESARDDPDDLHHTALDALGDANRRAIVEILGGGALSVQQIAEQLPISRPAVSRHLRLLKEGGLVDDEPDGTRRLYQLRAAGVEAIHQYFAEVWGRAVIPDRSREHRPPGVSTA
jgi:DNA-binding transcriptional ArsR family regulator